MFRPTRRQAVKAVTGATAGVALAGMATAWADTGSDDRGTTAPFGSNTDLASFDEVFEGRRIQGQPVRAAGSHASGTRASGHGSHGGHAGHGTFRVLIDGRDLQVMHHEGTGWSSAINHYERFATPLDAARTAVTSLKGASLVPFDPTA
ncbi:tyrosinase family oxidase copper chaperone [Streptomyces sp. NPDC050504]|uniref:apotyrosinase chaperone MelC1 n=1 Tax=Streptomyces sp. NPDC050504 TaxID=3365618 RepID=UPI0037A3610E